MKTHADMLESIDYALDSGDVGPLACEFFDSLANRDERSRWRGAFSGLTAEASERLAKLAIDYGIALKDALITVRL